MDEDYLVICEKSFLAQIVRPINNNQWRHFMVINGSDNWQQQHLKTLHDCIRPTKTLYIGAQSNQETLFSQSLQTPDKARGILGQEFDWVIYNSKSGLDPDCLGIVGGCIKAQGLFILLCPSLAQWLSQDDPQYKRLISQQFSPPSQSHYIARAAKQLKTSNKVLWIEQGLPYPDLPIYKASTMGSSYCDQKKAIEAVKKVISGQRKRPTLLLADRGRGKSAALGLAAKELVIERGIKVAVTGLSKASVVTLFAHALATKQIQTQQILKAHIRFYPAEQLLSDSIEADIVLVDEAATLPLFITSQLLQKFPRMAFASTVHGYEGTGKGYLIRLQDLIEQYCRGYRICKLIKPIRWLEHDPLEQSLLDLLMLDAEIKPLPKSFQLNISHLKTRKVCPSRLKHDETLLKAIFALLSDAHYRTRPADLRALLDATHLSIYCLFQSNTLLGVTVISHEGQFDFSLSEKVGENKTRPQGHLLAETLIAQLGIKQAGSLNIARIVRIAIHPKQQNQGLGTKMMKDIEKLLQYNSVDLIGTAFALHTHSLSLWQGLKYQTIFISHKPGKYTGTHSATQIKALSTQAEIISHQAQQKFQQGLALQLPRNLSSVAPEYVIKIYSGFDTTTLPAILSKQEIEDILAFAKFHRNINTVLYALIKLTQNSLIENSSQLDLNDKILLMEKILQNKNWILCKSLHSTEGKKQGMKKLRAVVDTCLQHYLNKRAEKSVVAR